MTEPELQVQIAKLKLNDELTYIEVKTGLDDIKKIGETISALSNSASWKGEEYAYFIWGIENNTWEIVGTKFDLNKDFIITRKEKKVKHNGKIWLLNQTTYFEDFEIVLEGKRLYVLKINNCRIVPIYFDKIAYIRIGSHNQELLRYPEIHRQILNKNQNSDWSAQICEGATIVDLDDEALELAKNGYIAKQSRTEEDKKRIRNYSNQVFLDEAKITKDGKITNATILLLGKDKSQHYLRPGGGAEIFWREMTSLDDQSFKMPLIKSIQAVINKITTRNIEMSLKVLGQPIMNKIKPNYSDENLRECIANCVAHQDYTQSSRIVIYEERNINIRFENAGACLYSKEEFNQIRLKKKIPTRYRNEFLRNAMEQIGLIEAKGTGHYKIYQYNTTEVYLPLPEIKWDNQKEFVLTLYGASLDQKFAEILQIKTDFEPEEILLLDQVQKNFRIDTQSFNKLKKQRLVEGTPTKGRLSLGIAQLLDSGDSKINEANYFQNSIDNQHLIELLSMKIKKQNCTRQDLEFIYEKMPENLNEKEKYTKLSNLLSKQMSKRKKCIKNVGSRIKPIWKWIK